MIKHIPISVIDRDLLEKLLKAGLYPLKAAVTVGGQDMGHVHIYIEQEDGMFLGTTNEPDAKTLIDLLVEASTPVRIYPNFDFNQPRSEDNHTVKRIGSHDWSFEFKELGK